MDDELKRLLVAARSHFEKMTPERKLAIRHMQRAWGIGAEADEAIAEVLTPSASAKSE